MSFPGLREAVGASEGTALFGPGLISSISAGTKLDRMAKSGRMGADAINRLELNVKRLAEVNNKNLLAGKMTSVDTTALGSRISAAMGSPFDESLLRSLSSTPLGTGASTLETSMAAVKAGERGVAGNLMASAMAGPGTQYLAGYFRGAQGFASAAGLEGKALMGAQKAVSHMTSALGTEGIKVAGTKFVGEAGAKALLEGSVLKQLGTKGTFKALTTSAGAKVLGARAAAFAIPGLQMVLAASLVYDLAKMGGEVIKSGINLARDANKSLQGSINKPMFGMGYQDTELAATSRARGVMAIQNSRLNARSVLGSEAAMMAAHFG